MEFTQGLEGAIIRALDVNFLKRHFFRNYLKKCLFKNNNNYSNYVFIPYKIDFLKSVNEDSVFFVS